MLVADSCKECWNEKLSRLAHPAWHALFPAGLADLHAGRLFAIRRIAAAEGRPARYDAGGSGIPHDSGRHTQEGKFVAIAAALETALLQGARRLDPLLGRGPLRLY